MTLAKPAKPAKPAEFERASGFHGAMIPINKQASHGMTHGTIDYKNPTYPLASKIVDHLINTGILSKNAHITSATAQVMIILGKRAVVIEEKTFSKELLDLEHKKLAEKKAARTARKKEMNEINERKKNALEKEMTIERNFYTAAKGMMDLSDFIALKQIAEEQINKKLKS